ncbi:MAG: hypothetical protein QM278_08010 [Pseudomonadota bacterium]|nr:hypothetical protein [Pseudomonadota bacterium]
MTKRLVDLKLSAPVVPALGPLFIVVAAMIALTVNQERETFHLPPPKTSG